MNVAPTTEPPQSLAVVCKRVRPILAASAEFRALPRSRQDKLTRDMVLAASAFARRQAGTPTASDLVESVDFPTFVAGLIHGTFEAIVDASARQMSAYTELLRNVAKSVDEFLRDNVLDCDDAVGEKVDRKRLAAQRQQVLATMVLMGITRIVVTDGRINASVSYELEPR